MNWDYTRWFAFYSCTLHAFVRQAPKKRASFSIWCHVQCMYLYHPISKGCPFFDIHKTAHLIPIDVTIIVPTTNARFAVENLVPVPTKLFIIFISHLFLTTRLLKATQFNLTQIVCWYDVLRIYFKELKYVYSYHSGMSWYQELSQSYVKVQLVITPSQVRTGTAWHEESAQPGHPNHATATPAFVFGFVLACKAFPNVPLSHHKKTSQQKPRVGAITGRQAV